MLDVWQYVHNVGYFVQASMYLRWNTKLHIHKLSVDALVPHTTWNIYVCSAIRQIMKTYHIKRYFKIARNFLKISKYVIVSISYVCVCLEWSVIECWACFFVLVCLFVRFVYNWAVFVVLILHGFACQISHFMSSNICVCFTTTVYRRLMYRQELHPLFHVGCNFSPIS